MKDYIIKCIESGNIDLYIQPFINLNTNRICGGEILSRLHTSDDKIIMPNEFLEVVSQNHIQAEFDLKIFSKTCAWISKRFKDGMNDKIITCNFSKETVSNKDFIRNITGIVNGYGIDCKMLGIEILEDEASGTENFFESNLTELHKLGFNILLDDWGKGYTSYEDIYNLDIDILKIDKSIIKNADTERGKKIFENILSLAHSLGIKALCEGIEIPTQAVAAKTLGCDIAQGFYFGVPQYIDNYNVSAEKHYSDN